jgi:hypothetical protein
MLVFRDDTEFGCECDCDEAEDCGTSLPAWLVEFDGAELLEGTTRFIPAELLEGKSIYM